jgi:hypothetical protein
MRLKNIVILLVVTLVVESVLVVGVVVWFRNPLSAVTPPTFVSSGLNATDAEQVLKEKLDNYNKRSDDLQKLISLLLGLTTIYAIVLAVSAYTSVQSNLQQADKSIARLDKLKQEHEIFMEKSREIQHKVLEELREKTTFASRIAIATVASQFPFHDDSFKEVQETVINTLLELRNGNYSTDRAVNQLIGRLYKALRRFRNAEEAMTSLIERKERLGERDDEAMVDAYFDRAGYQSLRWATANADEQTVLRAGIQRDLGRAISLDDRCRAHAQTDKDFDSIAEETWFKDLLRC